MDGKDGPYKVVKLATDITKQKVRELDLDIKAVQRER
jgi:hypothetical protein